MGDTDGDDPASTPGAEVADQERSFWDNRRLAQELDDDEDGRRQRRRLVAQGKQMNLRVRMHRYARRQDPGPVREDMLLPPLPDEDHIPADEDLD